jgi:hypothetical protein
LEIPTIHAAFNPKNHVIIKPTDHYEQWNRYLSNGKKKLMFNGSRPVRKAIK